MILDSARFVISICPECNEISKEKITVFNLSGGKGYTRACPDKECGERLWEMKEAQDKYRITVNCPACEEHHTYTMSKRNFWGKKYFAFNCPTWEIGILYFGDDEKFVESQMNAQSNSISEMLTDLMDYDEVFTVMYDIIGAINDIAKEGGVSCGCDNTDVTMVVEEDKVVLSCKNCGKKKTILPTEENVELLMETGTIVLDDTILN